MKMTTLSKVVVCFAFIALGCALVTSLAQAKPSSSLQGKVTLDFKDVELTDLIQTVSELTGENFLYDDSVKGRVTIISPEGMSLKEAYQLFLTVLNVKGYTVVPSGKINKIVPLKAAKESNLPTFVNGKGRSGEQYITRIFQLKNLDASTLGPTVLAPLVPKTANVTSYASSNSLIITDTAANLERLAKIISELDQAGPDSQITVVQLENSSADDLAKILNEIMSQSPVQGSSRLRRKTAAQGSNEVTTKIIPYPAGQSLIVVADQESLETIQVLVKRLDKEISGTRSNINLYYLENADAVTLATTLNEILSGIKREAQLAQKGGKAANVLASGPVTITADKPTNALIINAGPDDYRTMEEIIKKLDIKRKQVYVEALILELSMDATQRLGASLQGAGVVSDDGLLVGGSNLNSGPVSIGGALGSTDGVPDLLTSAVGGLLTGGFFNPVTVAGPDGNDITVPALSVLIDVSKTDSDVNLLSAPRLLTSDNEEAEIIVGANVPIITGRLTNATGDNSLAQSVAVERQDVALILRFTPQITEGDLVRLNVYQEITDIAQSSVGNIEDVGPTFTKRVLRNTVVAENRKTIVLGGLIDTNVVDTVTKVPLLGDIPLLGWLFKRKTTKEEKTNLLVFINPTIIKSPEDLEQVTGRNRKVADGFMGEKLRQALPENFLAAPANGNSSLLQSREEPAAHESTPGASANPLSSQEPLVQGNSPGGAALWVTPKPVRSDKLQ